MFGWEDDDRRHMPPGHDWEAEEPAFEDEGEAEPAYFPAVLPVHTGTSPGDQAYGGNAHSGKREPAPQEQDPSAVPFHAYEPQATNTRTAEQVGPERAVPYLRLVKPARDDETGTTETAVGGPPATDRGKETAKTRAGSPVRAAPVAQSSTRPAKRSPGPPNRGLVSTVEHDTQPAPGIDTAETKILRVLRASGSDVSAQLLVLFADLDRDARERLMHAIKSYRPGKGGELGEIAARFVRLDSPAQRQLFDALAMPARSAVASTQTHHIDVVHDPALAPNGPLSFSGEPNSIAVETSCQQDPATKDIAELVKGIPVATPAAKVSDDTAKSPTPAALAHYLNIRSREVWGTLREYIYAAVWAHVPQRLEWNDALFNAIVINELEAAELTEKQLRELLYPHDVFTAIAPHVIDGKEQHLPGAVRLILGQLFRAALGPSVARMTGRYVDVADAMYAADPTSAPTVRRDQLFASSPIDRYVASALTSGIARVAPDADILSGKRKPPRVALRPVKLTFMGATDPALWFIVRAEPGDATPEEVAASLFAYEQQHGEATSYYAYGLASAGALHALPASWAIQFPEARQYAPKAVQEGTLPEATTDSIGARLAVIASSDASDAIALAQAGHDPSAANLSAAQVGEVFGECAIQLEHLRRGLVPWELADPIVAEIGYVVGKRSHLAGLPRDQLGGWGAIALGQRERLYQVAAGLHAINDAAASMGLADKRSKSADALREIVARYANAGATSHLASTCEQILAEAQRMQAGLSLRALQANVVELESAMEGGNAVAGSDKQMREQAHAYLETKEEARILEGKLLGGGEVSAEELERVQIQAQELAIQARLHTTQIQLDQLVDAWRSAGQGLIPTIVASGKFNDIGPVSFHIHAEIGAIYNELNAEAKQVKPVNDQTGGTLESAQLDARRAALSRAQQRFAQLQQDRDLAHFFNAAYDAVKSQQLRTAITHAALAIGIGLASAGVAGWVANGLVAAEGVGVATELSLGARVAVAATEVMGNAAGQTITSAGEQNATSFAGALVDNAAFVLAPKMLGPAEKEIHAAKAFEQMLEKQLATIEAQEVRAAAAMRVLAKTGRVVSWTAHQAGSISAHTIMGMAAGALVAKGHEVVRGNAHTHAAGGAELTQDLIIQGASVAIGKLVHASIGERLPGLRQLAKRRDLAHTQQLLTDALALHELAAEVSVHPDAKLALELLHKRSALLEAELRVLDDLAAREVAHPTEGGPSTREIAEMRTDIKAQLGEVANQAMLDVQWRLLGLHELAPGVWSGTPEQTAAAIEEAKASGHHVKSVGDEAEVSRRVQIDGKDVELHARSEGREQRPSLKENKLDQPKRTLDDFLGEQPSPTETVRAKQQATAEAEMSIDEQTRSITLGHARSEREMLLAIKNGEMPRYVARVSLASKHATFANPNRPFAFATEPADLRGLTGAQAMWQVGWTREWIQGAVGKEIEITILDTHALVERSASEGHSEPSLAHVEVGPVEWNDIAREALADVNFMDAAEAQGISKQDLVELFSRASGATMVESVARVGPKLAPKMQIVIDLMNRLWSANRLYTGIGATMSEGGKTGAREVMVKPNGTGLRLTDANSRKISLGVLTQEQVDDLFGTKDGRPQ